MQGSRFNSCESLKFPQQLKKEVCHSNKLLVIGRLFFHLWFNHQISRNPLYQITGWPSSPRPSSFRPKVMIFCCKRSGVNGCVSGLNTAVAQQHGLHAVPFRYIPQVAMISFCGGKHWKTIRAMQVWLQLCPNQVDDLEWPSVLGLIVGDMTPSLNNCNLGINGFMIGTKGA